MQQHDHNDADGRFGHWKNLWAPWRMQYIDTLADHAGGCFLCDYAERPQRDEEQLVILRRTHCFALMNRFPYTGGHLLAAPYAHVATMDDFDGELMRELMELCRDMQAVLRRALSAQGFNVGFNVGGAGGAGLPGHIHMHIVPRWEGDTNFMTVLGDVRVIPQAMSEIRQRIDDSAAALGFK